MYKKLFFIGALAVSLSGCISAKSYVDPGFGAVSYSEIKSPRNRYAMNVEVEFQRNGTHYPQADQELRSHVERTLRATGIVQPEFGGSDTTIEVVVNNIADLAAAAAKGAGTGLTFGAAGSTVTDAYEVKIVLLIDGKEIDSTYQHALHTTIGNADAPFSNVQGTTPADAFGQVVEQVVVKFVRDMQSRNILVLLTN